MISSTPQKTVARIVSRGLSLAAILAFAALPSVARADGVPSAGFSGSASGSNASLSGPGTLNGSACSPGPEGGCESGTVTLAYSGGNASASASGTTSGGNGVPNAVADGVVFFFFIVSGPANTEVPLIFSGSGSTSASGVYATSQSQFYSPGGFFDACSESGVPGACSNGAGGLEPTSYAGQKFASISSNTLEDIEVIVGGGSTLGSGSWSASVDPTIEINPTFADAGEFTIEFSPDIITVPPSMPEPATWALLLIGIGVLFCGTQLRRSRLPGA